MGTTSDLLGWLTDDEGGSGSGGDPFDAEEAMSALGGDRDQGSSGGDWVDMLGDVVTGAGKVLGSSASDAGKTATSGGGASSPGTSTAGGGGTTTGPTGGGGGTTIATTGGKAASDLTRTTTTTTAQKTSGVPAWAIAAGVAAVVVVGGGIYFATKGRKRGR